MTTDAETAALDLALEVAGDMEGGFAVADISYVDAVCSLIDANLATYGFVVQLTDGTRRQIKLSFDDMVENNEVEVELIDLTGSNTLPHLLDSRWSADVDHLNARLAALKRQ